MYFNKMIFDQIVESLLEPGAISGTCIEMTRRYARLTDKTREEEYHRAMAVIVIEEGGIHGQY